jgi:hypothetical protein
MLKQPERRPGMNILFGWELGAGQGHIQRLVALARKWDCGF